MHDIGANYHYMSEFERDGFAAVWGRIKDELKGKRIYISVDIDVLDPAHVPGTSNPEPSGLTARKQGVTDPDYIAPITLRHQ